jgi:hypothetical protein
MDQFLGPLAFALLIGGQFLAAIVLASMRETLYVNPNEQVHRPVGPTSECPKATTLQHCATPEVALARLALAEQARVRAAHILSRATASEPPDPGGLSARRPTSAGSEKLLPSG